MKMTKTNKTVLSEKQLEVLETMRSGKLRRINILEGSVRSGKTYVSLILWGFWVSLRKDGCTFLMAAKTMGTLRRNVLLPLQDIFGEENFSFSVSKKEAFLFGKRIYLESANDSRSESKIRGMTLDGAYCDELTLFDENFFTMLLSRLSRKGAKLIATTNPDHPRHWLKRKYIDNKEIDLLDFHFSIDDNPYLDKGYVRELKKEYKGMYYDRFILGQWVCAEGRIYEEFGKKNVLDDKELHKRLDENPISFEVVGVDFGGNKSASVYNLVAFDKGYKNVYVLDEYYDKENKSAEHLINSFIDCTQRWSKDKKLLCAYCDSAEQLLIKSLRNAVRVDVRNALKRPVNSRINMLCRLISAGRFFISDKCVHLIEALETAVWDSSKLNCDQRLDDGTTNIDSLDALEYAIERYESHLFKV